MHAVVCAGRVSESESDLCRDIKKIDDVFSQTISDFNLISERFSAAQHTSLNGSKALDTL
jgi:hypothetical protein